MSFDVFFQRFANGDARCGGNPEAIVVLEPYLVRDAEGQITRLRTDDGSAQLFGLGGADGFMANHIDGSAAWDVLVEAARAAGFAIMPVGCSVCVPSVEIAAHLPPELVTSTQAPIVNTGRDLMASACAYSMASAHTIAVAQTLRQIAFDGSLTTAGNEPRPARPASAVSRRAA